MVEAMETLQGQGQGHVWVEVDMGCLNEGIQIREKVKEGGHTNP